MLSGAVMDSGSIVIVDYTVEHPILRHTRRQLPGIEVTWEDSYRTADDAMQMLVWIEYDEFDAVEAALGEDPSVENPTVLTDVGTRRMYRVDLVGRARETSAVPKVVEVGGVFRSAVGTESGWRISGQFPDRDAFEQLYRFYEDHGIEFAFDGIYEPTDSSVADSPELTEAQREILVEAVDSDYLAVPRQCSLAELADRLGISESAASERFRRGARVLVEQTVIE
jgi:predicted DNA binding protein